VASFYLKSHQPKPSPAVGITSQTVIEELLEEDKPGKINKTKEEIEHFIAESRLVVREAITLKEIEPYQQMIDREDAHLIAGANLTKCTYLVSFDKKHVLAENVKNQFHPLKIVNPKELIAVLVEK